MRWMKPTARLKRLATVLLAGSAVLAIGVAAQAAERVALVMGNGAYRDVPQLVNAHNDANDVARLLQQLDFLVIEAIDQDLDGMKAELASFQAELDDARLAVVFYAGHAVQMSGQNYLLPTDADPRDARARSLSMQQILNMMADKVETRVVLLDACRDNPYADAELQEAAALTRGLRAGGARSAVEPADGGLAAVDATEVGTFVAYATAPGSVALDGSGRNSPFTTALLKHLPVEGVPLTSVMQKVRGEVVTATAGKQVPWDSSSLTVDPVFNGGTDGQSTASPPPAPSPPAQLVSLPNVAVEALLTGDQSATRSLADALDPVVDSEDGAAMLEALRRGEPASALVLADMVIQGRVAGFAPNSAEGRTLAMQLLAMAAGRGQREAPIKLVQLIEGADDRLTLDDALLRLSDYLATGSGGLPVNQQLSLSFLIESAGRNNALAQLNLADRLRNGEGFAADPDHALKIYNKIKRTADFAGTDAAIVADAQAGIDAIRGGAFVPD